MSKPGRPSASPTQLARRRREAGLSQMKLAELTGLSNSTIQRLERGEVANAKLRHLANCAVVLDCQVEDLIEPSWREWWPPGRVPPSPQEVSQARNDSFRPNPPYPVRGRPRPQ